MSSTLTWEPLDRKKHVLSDDLKFAMRRGFSMEPVNTRLSTQDIPFLRGMVAAGISDGEKLIDAIQKYGTIIVQEEF